MTVIDFATRLRLPLGDAPDPEDLPVQVTLPLEATGEAEVGESAATGEHVVTLRTADGRLLLQWRLPPGAIPPLPGQRMRITIEHDQ